MTKPTLSKIAAESIKTGDVILPPAREMRLWMRREIAAGNMTEDALYITVRTVEQGKTDKRGQWLVIRGEDSRGHRWNISARSNTPWPVVQGAR